jgi:hypothetical protein
LKNRTVCLLQPKKWIERIAIFLLFFSLSCAQAQKESVELSVTVGRDITQVHQSHHQLAVIIYDRIKKDINKFVDEVYAPYQIHHLLKADQEDFRAGNQDTLFGALDAAIKKPNKLEIQKTALEAINVFIQLVRDDVESYRRKRLTPILAQEQEVLSAIDRAYHQIHYANSIVTGHLASIVKVHDAQEDVLNQFGLEGLPQEIGQRLASTSNSVAEFVERGKRLNFNAETIEKLTEELDLLVKGCQEKEKQKQ